MNRTQKMAWLTLISSSIGLALSIIAIAVLYFRAGFPQAWNGLAFMAIAGISGFGLLIFKKDPGQIQFDERDKLIKQTAKRLSMRLFCVTFIILYLALSWYNSSHGIEMVPVSAMKKIIWGPAIVTFLSYPLTILILYHKGNKATEGELT